MRIHWKRFFRLRRWVKSISFFLSDPIYRLPQNEGREKGSLLLIKTEAIGDYILFRNFLQSIRENEKFRGYQIFLIGNELWKPLVNKFDQPYVDFSFFINKKKFLSEPKYRQEFLSQFSKIHFANQTIVKLFPLPCVCQIIPPSFLAIYFCASFIPKY